MGCCWLGFLLLGFEICSADPTLRSRNLIIGGSTAKLNRFPYFVALKDRNRDIQCGGTLIAPDIVLTAAHCRGSNLVYADVGKYTNDNQIPEGLGEEIEIMNPLEMISSGWSTVRNLETSNHSIIDAAGFIHPDHDIDLRTFDVMLMKLARPSTRPLAKINHDSTVPVKQPGGRNEITIIGLGNTDSDGTWPKPKDLQQVHVNYLPYDECIDVENYNLDYKYELLPHMICVEGAGVYGDRGQCYGDSGGPYILMGSNYTEDVQVGIVSWSVNCANPIFPMVGSRTSESIDFIKEVTCSISASPPADLCAEENNSVGDDLQNRFISNGVRVSVRIFADPFGHELRWRITDQLDFTNIYADIPYGRITEDHLFQEVVVPAGANLRFQIDDAADDGIYGDPEAILYEIVLIQNSNEVVMVEGNGQFGTSREELFRVPQINDDYLALVRASNAAAAKSLETVDGPTALLNIYIEFADYHEDASWEVTSVDGSKTYASKNADEYRYGTDVTEQIALTAGSYTFTISDRRGTDEFRAFNYYKLFYRNGLATTITVYESEGIFEGESISHEFEIPVSAVSVAVSDGQSSSQEVVISDTEFFAEAQTEVQTPSCGALAKLNHYCTSHEDCCSGVCSRFRCQPEEGASSPATTISDTRGRMRQPIRGNAGGSSRGYTRT